MKLAMFQVDAFAHEAFRGNPAAVVPLDAPLPDPLMQSIAAENNLSETAFVRLDAGSGTPQSPWPLRWFTPATEVDLCGHATLADALLLLDDEPTVRALRPDMARLAALDLFAVIVTAPGLGCDFVSRFFAPRKGVPEDPVTGSAHCTLTPFRAARLLRTRLSARQVSARGGELACELRGERVSIGGRVAPYLRGEIEVGGG